jgi:hypothetical protein
LHPERFASTRNVLKAWPELASAFAAPVGLVGLGDVA